MLFKNAWKHFSTITQHKWIVMWGCFQLGLYKQGILHDLSKYTPEEFRTGILYYQGNRSPNAAEKEDVGYSIDLGDDREKGMQGMKMPIPYVVEMFVDRLAASKVYAKGNYTDSDALNYYKRTWKYMVIHPDSRKLLERLLIMNSKYGEEKTFDYIRRIILKGKYNY